MIPKSQFLYVLFFQKLTALFIVLHLFRNTVLKAIKLDVQPCYRTIEIQNVDTLRMLPSKFEPGKMIIS